MKVGQRVVCKKRGIWVDVHDKPSRPPVPVYNGNYTVDYFGMSSIGAYVVLREFPNYPNGFLAKWFVPEEDTWTEEVITEALKKQLTEPVNNGLHFSQIIG